ncbi:Uncharacterised protein [Mycobacteroides abscessus]|nr:Uncharacterised protein [Mycobacteroides abscessus]
MTLRPHLIRRQLCWGRARQVCQIVVCDGHALGDTCGARGVDEIRDVIGLGTRIRWAVDDLHFGIVHIGELANVDDGHLAAIEPPGKAAGGNHGCRRRVVQHEIDTCRRHHRVDREIRRTGLQHRQHGDDRLRRSLQEQRYTASRHHARPAEPERQPVRGIVKFPVSQRVPAASYRHCLRGARHLVGEQRRDGHRVDRALLQQRTITHGVQAGVLGRVEHVNRRQPALHISGHCGQHQLEAAE